VPIVAGCGRLGFGTERSTDAATPPDAGELAFGAGCAVGLAMDEPRWTGAAGEVVNRCATGTTISTVGPGTAVAGASLVDDPVRGRVGDLPLPSGCVQIANAAGLHATTGLTLSAWIYPQSLDGTNPYGVIAKRTDFTMDDAEYTMFVWTDNTVWVDIDSRNDRAHGVKQVVNGAWQQLTAVYDGTLPAAKRVTLYVDGELDAVLPETSPRLTAYPSPLSVGCLPELPATKPQIALGGRIDDVGVWTRAFTAQEVAAWYQATRH